MKKLLLFVLAIVVLTACKSAPKGEAKAAAQPAMKVGIQLYSLRGDCEKDLEGVLKALGEAGYDGVELAGFYQYSPEEFKALCDKYGLLVIHENRAFNAGPDWLDYIGLVFADCIELLHIWL